MRAHRGRTWQVVVVPVAVVLLAAGCTSETGDPVDTSTSPGSTSSGDGSASPSQSAPASTETSDDATTEGSDDGSNGADPLTSTPTGEAVEPGETSTGRRTAPSPAARIELVSVEVDDDEVRVTTEGGAAGYDIGYVEAVVLDGEPVVPEADAVVQLDLTGVDPNGDEGIRQEVAVDLASEDGPVRRVRYLRYLDGVVTFSIDVAGDPAFTVEQDGTSLVLDFED